MQHNSHGEAVIVVRLLPLKRYIHGRQCTVVASHEGNVDKARRPKLSKGFKVEVAAAPGAVLRHRLQ